MGARVYPQDVRPRHSSEAAALVQGLSEPEPQRGLEEAAKRPGHGTTMPRKSLETSPPASNRTGLPAPLQAGVEDLAGIALDDVRVHYQSSKPADVQALAYTQGADIYVGPGQEQHLAHEVWHVVQQKQRRVRPTRQAKGLAINDDAGLEQEAAVMGAKAAQARINTNRLNQGKDKGHRISGLRRHFDLQCHKQNQPVTDKPIQRTVAKTDLDQRYRVWLSQNEAEFLQYLQMTRKNLFSVNEFLTLADTTKALVQQEMENYVSTRAKQATTKAVEDFGNRQKVPARKNKFDRSEELKSPEKLTKVGQEAVDITFKREPADLKPGTPLYHCTDPKAAQAIMGDRLKVGTGIRDIGRKYTLDPSLVGRISFTTDPNRKLPNSQQLVLILTASDIDQYSIFHFSTDEYVATSPIPGNRFRRATPNDKKTSAALGFAKK